MDVPEPYGRPGTPGDGMMSEKIDNGSEKVYLKLCEVTPNEYENRC